MAVTDSWPAQAHSRARFIDFFYGISLLLFLFEEKKKRNQTDFVSEEGVWGEGKGMKRERKKYN